MLLDFYNLREEPFGVTPDPKYLYLSPTHREALASLIYGIKSGRGFMALLAEPGMGKTTLLFSLLERLRNSARTAFLFNTQCNSLEFLRHLLSDLGIDTGTHDAVEMHQRLNKFLVGEAQAGRQVVAIVDEAQNLSHEVLESVRLLSNFETPSAKLIQIILAGQPLLREKLASPPLAQLRQRLSIISHLDPFTANETYRYIDHRVSIAGSTAGELFDSEARTLIATASQGIPRNINNLCFAALSLGSALRKKPVNGSILREVTADLDIASFAAGPYSVPASRSLPSPARTNDTRELEAGNREPAAGYEQAFSKAGFPSHRESPRPSPARRFFHITAREKNKSYVEREGTEPAAGPRAAPKESAENLSATQPEPEARATHWELRAALVCGLIILLGRTSAHYLWNQRWADQTTVTISEAFEDIAGKARDEFRMVAPSPSKDADHVGALKQTVFSERVEDNSMSSAATMVGDPPAAAKPVDSASGQPIVDSSSPGARSVPQGQTHSNWGSPSESRGDAEGARGISLLKDDTKSATQTAEVENGGVIAVRSGLTHWRTSNTLRENGSGTELPLPGGKGVLRVETTPPGASIYIDGNSRGRSPVEAILSAGQHTYRVELPGYSPYDKVVNVEDGMITARELRFGNLAGSDGGTVHIATNPSGAGISVDGIARGNSPRFLKLATGMHRMVLTLSGYQPVSQDINVPENQTLSVSSALSPLVAPQRSGQPAKQVERASPGIISREEQE